MTEHPHDRLMRAVKSFLTDAHDRGDHEDDFGVEYDDYRELREALAECHAMEYPRQTFELPDYEQVSANNGVRPPSCVLREVTVTGDLYGMSLDARSLQDDGSWELVLERRGDVLQLYVHDDGGFLYGTLTLGKTGDPVRIEDWRGDTVSQLPQS